jgi:hypothetical protein
VHTGKHPHLDGGGVPVGATPRGAVPGLARDGGRHAPASVLAWMEGRCRPLPHNAEPFPDLPALVGGAHRQVFTPGAEGVPTTATLRGAVPGLACNDGRRTPASVRAWAERGGVSTAATPRGAVSGLAHMVGGAHRQSSICLDGGGCRPPPHRAEPFNHSPAMMGGTHRQASC